MKTKSKRTGKTKEGIRKMCKPMTPKEFTDRRLTLDETCSILCPSCGTRLYFMGDLHKAPLHIICPICKDVFTNDRRARADYYNEICLTV